MSTATELLNRVESDLAAARKALAEANVAAFEEAAEDLHDDGRRLTGLYPEDIR